MWPEAGTIRFAASVMGQEGSVLEQRRAGLSAREPGQGAGLEGQGETRVQVEDGSRYQGNRDDALSPSSRS